MSKLISIDPGNNGAYAAFVDGVVTAIKDLPITPLADSKTRKVVDVDLFSAWLSGFRPDIVVIERVNAGPADGRGSAGQFMLNLGTIIGATAGWPRAYVLPDKWKTYSGLRGKPKAASVKKAHERHPETIAFIQKQKNAVDRADAVLMGSYYIDMILKEGRR